MNVARNSESGRQLQSFVERVEQVNLEMDDLKTTKAAILAEAKSAGFVPKAITFVIKKRKMKPHEREEAEALEDTYLAAMGMAHDTPLFRAVGLMNIDRSSRDEVIEAAKKFVPDNGSITIEVEGKSVLLKRDPKTGEVEVFDVVVRSSGEATTSPRPVHRDPPPAVDDAGAEELGAQAYRDNKPVIGNPFPFGDSRRPAWDAGWRKASGSDGMGPEGKKKGPGKGPDGGDE